uniref:DNA primase small subunit n=1 Tax=Jaculus jaculus TaxID=51337 RepID=UPI001E1B508C|nr:DNA primase small subunit [Jaculus jaculus]
MRHCCRLFSALWGITSIFPRKVLEIQKKINSNFLPNSGSTFLSCALAANSSGTLLLISSYRRSINIIKKYFEEYALVGQDILENKESWDKILALLPETIHDELQKHFQKSHSSLQRWEQLKKTISTSQNMKNDKCGPWLEWEIMLQYCFPRLDINVSKGINHLLKSPFSVHPKTGRISVPIDLQKVDQFDPFTVPTISSICRELDVTSTNEKENENEAESETKHRPRDYKKTSLAPYVKVFEQFLENLDKSRKGELLKKSDLQKDF